MNLSAQLEVDVDAVFVLHCLQALGVAPVHHCRFQDALPI